MSVSWHSIRPILSDAQYKKLRFTYLTPELGPQEIEPNIVYHDEGRIKFLLLSEAIPPALYMRINIALKEADWANCARAANGQKRGKKITIGWYPQKPNYSMGSGYTNVRTAKTLEQPELVAALRPVLRGMAQKMEEELPSYYDYASRVSLRAWRPANEKDDLSRVPRLPEHLLEKWDWQKKLMELSDEEFEREYAGYRAARLPDPYAIVEGLDPWDVTYTLFGTPFSTVELNRNIIFKAHEDGHNAEGTLVCIAAPGTSVGGPLLFPRYGYSAELGPRDLLICDNNHELHGNVGPIIGERFSVVAFLHESVLDRGDSGS